VKANTHSGKLRIKEATRSLRFQNQSGIHQRNKNRLNLTLRPAAHCPRSSDPLSIADRLERKRSRPALSASASIMSEGLPWSCTCKSRDCVSRGQPRGSRSFLRRRARRGRFQTRRDHSGVTLNPRSHCRRR